MHASNRTGGEEGGEGKLDCVTAARPHAPPTPWEGGIGKGRGIFKKPVHGKSGGLFLWRIMAALYIRKGGGGYAAAQRKGRTGCHEIASSGRTRRRPDAKIDPDAPRTLPHALTKFRRPSPKGAPTAT